MEGKIDRNGHLTAKLVHVQPHPPDKWLPQTGTAILEPDGKAVHGYGGMGGRGLPVRLAGRGSLGGAEENELSK